jgi:hypothetical protein
MASDPQRTAFPYLIAALGLLVLLLGLFAIVWPFDIPLGDEEPELSLSDDDIRYEAVGFTDRAVFDHTSYTYDEVIVVTCQPGGLAILDTFPATLAPPNAQTDLYNPYTRIRQAFITSVEAGLLAR